MVIKYNYNNAKEFYCNVYLLMKSNWVPNIYKYLIGNAHEIKGYFIWNKLNSNKTVIKEIAL